MKNIRGISYPSFEEDCVVVLDHKDEKVGGSNALVFTPPVHREEDMLASFLEPSTILYRAFHRGILYLLVKQPVVLFEYEKVAKNCSFRALARLTEAVLSPVGSLTVDDCTEFRHFNRNARSWKKWCSWYPFVYEVTKQSFLTLTGTFPSTLLAQQLKKLIAAAAAPARSTIPLEFYTCEITFDEQVPCGILFQTSPFGHVTYVSPMVVSNQTRTFLDVNRQICPYWLPLYKNRATWLEHGLPLFVGWFKRNVDFLKGVLEWLSAHSQTEKYRYMWLDLQIINRLL